MFASRKRLKALERRVGMLSNQVKSMKRQQVLQHEAIASQPDLKDAYERAVKRG